MDSASNTRNEAGKEALPLTFSSLHSTSSSISIRESYSCIIGFEDEREEERDEDRASSIAPSTSLNVLDASTSMAGMRGRRSGGRKEGGSNPERALLQRNKRQIQLG